MLFAKSPLQNPLLLFGRGNRKNGRGNRKIQIVIDNIEKALKQETTTRQLIKMENSSVIEAITDMMKRFDSEPKLIKVKAHVKENEKYDGWEFNDEADRLAKEACKLNVKMSKIEKHKNQKCKVYTYKNNTIIDSYPTRIIKKQNKIKQNREALEQVTKQYDKTINVNTTIEITYTGMEKKSGTDLRSYREQAWRIKLIMNNLPTLEQVSKFKDINKICTRCRIKIEDKYTYSLVKILKIKKMK